MRAGVPSDTARAIIDKESWMRTYDKNPPKMTPEPASLAFIPFIEVFDDKAQAQKIADDYDAVEKARDMEKSCGLLKA